MKDSPNHYAKWKKVDAKVHTVWFQVHKTLGILENEML